MGIVARSSWFITRPRPVSETAMTSGFNREHDNDVKVVQQLMRHAKLSTTTEIYMHPRMDKKQKTHSKVVGSLFGRQSPLRFASRAGNHNVLCGVVPLGLFFSFGEGVCD